ncbi:DUF4913 domain-containing protein (plasmid) [Streptomyces niveus]|uniref:DUF4913 domain-containing protein n=1 Tax=Streptomyces niveus TaxID=193462 RepID=UPI002E37D024|nr:DUF4913 domain-containing protein [Streptomyces niveus]
MTTPDVGVLADDLADLQATVLGFASQLEHNTKKLDAVAVAVTAGQGDGDEKGKEKPQTPPFILLLSGDEYTRELAALGAWVRDLLVPTYFAEISSSATWCETWWEHPAAVARLHGAWLAWQELTDPAVCGLTGPSVWHRDHLDPMITQIRDGGGPFAGCMTSPDRPQHAVLPVPPVGSPPAGPVAVAP